MGTSIKNLFLLAGLVGSLAVSAKGQSELETVTISPESQNPWNPLTFDVPQFNSSLGVLNSVDLTITPLLGNFGSLLSGDPPNAQVATGCTVSDPYGSLTDTTIGLTATYADSQTLTSPPIHVPAVLFREYGPALPFNFSTTPGSLSVSPTGFTGSGFDDLIFTQSESAGYSGGGNGWGASYYGYVGGSLQIEYNYTVVSTPEPTTISLVIMGLLGALTIKRSKGRWV